MLAHGARARVVRVGQPAPVYLSIWASKAAESLTTRLAFRRMVNRCKHRIVREWALGEPGKLEALQVCRRCRAGRLRRGGEWGRWRVLPGEVEMRGRGEVIRGAFPPGRASK